MKESFRKDWQYYKFCLYGFLKNQRFFEPFLILIFLREKGLSYTHIGTLYAIRFLLRTLFEIPSGFAADALGRKGTMLFSYSFYMLSFVMYYYMDSFLWLILPTLCFATGDAFRTGTHKAMIFEYLKRNNWQDQKVDYYGHTRSWSQTGSAISSLLAAALVLLNKNYNLIFLYSLVPYLIGFLLLASYPSYLNGTAGRKKDPSGILQEFATIIRDAVRAFSNRKNIQLTFNIASYSGFYNAAKDYLQVILSAAVIGLPFYSRLEVSKDEKEIILIGSVYFILYFLTAVASRGSGTVCRYFRTNARFLNATLIAGILVAIGAGLCTEFDSSLPAILLFLLIIIIENLRRPAGVSAIADIFDEKILASVLSVESQLSSLTGALLSFLIGFAADHIGPGYALSLAAFLLLVLIPLIRYKK